MADEKATESKWQCYIIPDLATWTGAAGSKPHTPIEFYDTYEQAVARFQELRSEPYNSEDLSAARLTLVFSVRTRPALPTCSRSVREKTFWWKITRGWHR